MQRGIENPDDTQITIEMAGLRADIAEQFYHRSNFQQAVEYLINSVQLDSTHIKRWEALGDMTTFINDPSSELIVHYAYEQVLKLDPTRRSTRIKLAGSYLKSQRFFKAMEHFEIVIGITDDEEDEPDHERQYHAEQDVRRRGAVVDHGVPCQ